VVNDVRIKTLLEEYASSPPPARFDVDAAIATGRRRRRARHASVIVVLLVLACTVGASVLALRPRSVEPVAPAGPAFALDGKALVVQPIVPHDTAVPASRAEQVLALQTVYVTSMQAPVLADVHWTANQTGSGPTALTLSEDTLAWVLVYQHGGGPEPACPIVAWRSSPTQTPGSAQSAVIVDATTGEAAVYEGAYGFCGGWTTPSIAGAARYESIPWTVVGDPTDLSSYRVTIPGCSQVAGSSASDSAMTIVAAEPVDGPCSASPTTGIVSGSVSASYADHAPVGLLCANHDQTVELARPEGCIGTLP
jgi:hypothetical protein